MADRIVEHEYVPTRRNSRDTRRIQPLNDHVFKGGTAGQVLTRDPNTADGAAWTTLPTGQPGPQGPPGPDTGIYVDDAGWLIVPGQLPRKTARIDKGDGSFQYVEYILDNGVEKLFVLSEQS